MSPATRRAAVLTGLTFLMAPWAMADQPAAQATPKAIQFAQGSSKATESGSVHGYDNVTYTVAAQAGEQFKISLKTKNTSNYFNVTAPGKDEALFVGSVSGNQATFTAEQAGDYVVNVYLMRNAARRGATAKYTLSVEKHAAK